MKVHLLQIPAEGKYYEGEDPGSVLDLHEDNLQPISPVRYALDVGLSDGGLFATGSLSVEMRMQCVKCLEAFEYPIAISDFACQIELPPTEIVDLTEPIREEIVLALPAHPHCDWNGEQTCPGAFSVTTEASAEPLSEPPAVWEALDHLKLQP